MHSDTDVEMKNLEQLIAAAERVEVILSAPEHAQDDTDVSAMAMTFMQSHIGDIIDLLHELKLRRLTNSTETGAGQGAGYVTHVEGVSDESAEQAFSSALEKASRYFSEYADVALTLEKLVALPEGGHRATVAIMITPFTLRHRPHVQNMDVQLKRIHDHEYYMNQKRHDEYIPHLVFDHFAQNRSAVPPNIPPFFLVNITDARLLNHMLEKQFLKAGGSLSPKPEMSHILVRTRLENDPHPEPD